MTNIWPMTPKWKGHIVISKRIFKEYILPPVLHPPTPWKDDAIPGTRQLPWDMGTRNGRGGKE